MSQWWRAHASAVDDPKIQRLPGDLFKAWFNVLCLACAHDGKLPPLADIAFKLRKSEDATAKILAALEAACLLDVTDDGTAPHNWNERQYKSDVSNERVKRHRERRRNGECNVTETPSESEADTEADTEQKVEKGRGGAVAPLPTVEAVELFNAAAEQGGWPRVQVLNPARKRALASCLHAVGGLEGWQCMLAKASASDFLSGRARRSDDHANWRMDFDFLLKRHVKIMEGGYDNSPNSQQPPERGISAVLAALAD